MKVMSDDQEFKKNTNREKEKNKFKGIINYFLVQSQNLLGVEVHY